MIGIIASLAAANSTRKKFPETTFPAREGRSFAVVFKMGRMTWSGVLKVLRFGRVEGRRNASVKVVDPFSAFVPRIYPHIYLHLGVLATAMSTTRIFKGRSAVRAFHHLSGRN